MSERTVRAHPKPDSRGNVVARVRLRGSSVLVVPADQPGHGIHASEERQALRPDRPAADWAVHDGRTALRRTYAQYMPAAG